ncbi:MAG: GIY-YIG nuclease family protein [Clostridia bacterium]|nr:GIY-YIG nuclease family protein [Clostridia bacterium]
MFYTYIIRCTDNTLYTGITTDPVRRFKEHISKGKNCAKYTLSHDAVKMEALWSSEDRISASRLEFKIKKMTKACKEKIICSPEKLCEILDLKEGEVICKFEKTLLNKVNENE